MQRFYGEDVDWIQSLGMLMTGCIDEPLASEQHLVAQGRACI
jgi:hypothetical protein